VKRVAAHSISNDFQESSMSFLPLHDRVVVRRSNAEAKATGGPFIPDSDGEKLHEGEIIALVEVARSKAGRSMSMSAEPGAGCFSAKVRLGHQNGRRGADIMHDGDILGVMA
jgi:chaperonin GroES